MKKSILCLLTASLLVLNSVCALADQAVAENLYNTYSTMLTLDNEDLPTLSLDEAVEKTLRNSSTVKNTLTNLDNLESNLDNASLSYTYSGDDNYSSLLALINAQVSLKNALVSQDSQNENLKYSVKQSFVDIINAQREIALAQITIKTAEANLASAKIKNKMGAISDSALKEQQLSYEKSLAELDSKKMSLDANYISLNILMGTSVNNRYSFSLPVTYEVLDTTVTVDSYVTNITANSSSIKQKENSLDLTMEQQKLSVFNSSANNAYTTAQNAVNSANLSLQDAKDNLSQTVRTLYSTIVQSETSITTSMQELDALKATLESTKTKHKMGTASNIALAEAEANVASKENALVSALYSHMLNIEKLKTPALF